MIEAEDPKWAAEFMEGRSKVIEALLERYEKPIFNTALRMLENYEDAREITQLVFVKAFENRASFNPRYKFFSWLYRIAVNECLNFLKRTRRFEELEKDHLAPDESPEELARRQEFVYEVQRALMNLKPDYRAVIVLKHFQDCSYHEIGYILEIPEKTVKSRLFRARRLLKEQLVKKGLVES